MCPSRKKRRGHRGLSDVRDGDRVHRGARARMGMGRFRGRRYFRRQRLRGGLLASLSPEGRCARVASAAHAAAFLVAVIMPYRISPLVKARCMTSRHHESRSTWRDAGAGRCARGRVTRVDASRARHLVPQARPPEDGPRVPHPRPDGVAPTRTRHALAQSCHAPGAGPARHAGMVCFAQSSVTTWSSTPAREARKCLGSV